MHARHSLPLKGWNPDYARHVFLHHHMYCTVGICHALGHWLCAAPAVYGDQKSMATFLHLAAFVSRATPLNRETASFA